MGGGGGWRLIFIFSFGKETYEHASSAKGHTIIMYM